MYPIEQNNALATYFPALHSKDKHLLDLPGRYAKTYSARTNKYGKEYAKHQCVRDWNNFEKKSPQIPANKLVYMKIKRILKQAIFDQY